ncbi:MAG: TMEM175 family protein [Streptosporangiaceae bacterium]
MADSSGRARDTRSTDDEFESGKTSLDRLVFFSDAVFAIAITLLVLPLADTELSDHQIGAQLLAQWPKMFSFVLSFVVIGTFWVSHHRMFRFIIRLDRRLLMINMLFLLFVAFLPFPTSVLGQHEDHTAAVVLYAVAISLTGLTAGALWRYACHDRRLVSSRLEPGFIRALKLRSLVVPIAFLPSIPVAFVDPTIAMYVWIAAYPANVIIGRLNRKAGRLEPAPSDAPVSARPAVHDGLRNARNG